MNVRLKASLSYSIFRDDRDSVAEMLTLFDTERLDRSARRFHDMPASVRGFKPGCNRVHLTLQSHGAALRYRWMASIV
ncbi:MAG: hypothetical protein OXD29_05430 [Roseovarius sp.]|nr:hypothetical protein [Roseovarius sp.]